MPAEVDGVQRGLRAGAGPDLSAQEEVADHGDVRDVHAQLGKFPRERHEDQDEGRRDTEPVEPLPRVERADAVAERPRPEAYGQRDTRGRHDVDPLRVQVGLVDDARDRHHGAQHQ